MTVSTVSVPVAELPQWSPPIARLALLRYRLEMRAFRRVREEVIFTFSLPILLLALFATIFGGRIDGTDVDVSQYYVAGMLASTGLTVGFQSLAAQLSLEQHDGTLKRLAGTPMPKAAYMLGKIGMVTTIAVIQAVTMFAIGVWAFGVTLPTASGSLILASVLALSLSIWTLLGLAFSRIIRDPRAGGAVTVPPALVLQFISGVYLRFDQVPTWLQQIASVFPLRWATLGTRRALLPDEFAAVEVGGTWQTPTMYLVLTGWLVVAAAAAGVVFRWRDQE